MVSIFTSQLIGQVTVRDTVKASAYFVEVGKKKTESDSTYYYSYFEEFQFSTLRRSSVQRLMAQSKNRIEQDNLYFDSLYLDCNRLYLDNLKNNNPSAYDKLKPITVTGCPVAKIPKNKPTERFFVNRNNEYSTTIKCLRGVWIELIVDREIAEQILGRDIRFLNPKVKNYHLFILYKQISSDFL